MNKQNGVTMISLIVVIIVIVILAATSIFSSKDLMTETRVAKVYNEIASVRNAITELKSLNETDPETYDMNKMLRGEKIENLQEYNQRVGWNLEEGNEYYYLGFGDKNIPDAMKKYLEEQLGVRGIEFSYVVGAETIEDIEVYLVDGIKIGNYYFYTYEDILNEYLKNQNK